MPWPKATTPPRIRITMPSDTRPLAAAIVIRKVSHLGMKKPPTASAAAQPRPRTATRQVGAAVNGMADGREAGETTAIAQIFRACVRWNRPSGLNISTTAITM